MALMLPTFIKKDIGPMDFNQALQKQASDAGLLGPRPRGASSSTGQRGA